MDLRTVPVAVALCLAAVVPGPLAATQKTTTLHPGTGGSIHVRTEWALAGALIAIEYGRPSLKGRELDTLAPPGRVWRLGADEATILRTSRSLLVGESRLAAGSYSLYAIPGAAEWLLIVNKQTGQWGTSYDDRQDVMRVPLTASALSPAAEQLTIVIDAEAGSGSLAILWGSVRAETRFRVSPTAE